MLSLEAIVIVLGWFTSLFVAVFLVPRIAAKRVCEQFGLTLVTQGGKKFFVPTDPNTGDPLKVPIGVKENEDGTQEVVLGYAPLAYSMPVIAAEFAAQKTKMLLLNTKSQISRKLGKEALQAGMIDEFMPFLPKKAQAAVAIARALGLGGNGSQQGVFQGQTGTRTGDNTFNPGRR